MTTLTTNNGHAPRQRRRLDDSIARMDQLIDGLADAIPDTIKDVLEGSVSQAISAGIKAALLETMANPELLAVLRSAVPVALPAPATAPPAVVQPPRPSMLRALLHISRAALQSSCRWVKDKVVSAARAGAGAVRQAAGRVARFHRQLLMTVKVCKALVLPLGVGCVAVAIALIAPNWAVIGLSGLSGSCLTFVVQVGWWVRRKLGALALTND